VIPASHKPRAFAELSVQAISKIFRDFRPDAGTNAEVSGEIRFPLEVIMLTELTELEAVGQIVTWKSSSDITRLIEELFEVNGGDLMPIHAGECVYFVPETHKRLTDAAESLLVSMGGMVSRFQVASDGELADQSIARIARDHMERLIGEFRSTCDVLNDRSPNFVISRRFESVNKLRKKVSAYQPLLAGFSNMIGHQLEDAEQFLRKQIGAEPSLSDTEEVMNRIQALLA
jgi:hypothetical protein